MKKIFNGLMLIMCLMLLMCPFCYADTGTSIVYMYDNVVQNLVVILGVLGLLAFMLELIVQLTKELPGIKRIPTKLYAIIISLIVCLLALYIYGAYMAIPIPIYQEVLAVLASFVVAYIAIFGWDTLRELYLRMKPTV